MAQDTAPATLPRGPIRDEIGTVELVCTGTWVDHRSTMCIAPEIASGKDPKTGEQVSIQTTGRAVIISIFGLPRLEIDLGGLVAQYVERVRGVELPPRS